MIRRERKMEPMGETLPGWRIVAGVIVLWMLADWITEEVAKWTL